MTKAEYITILPEIANDNNVDEITFVLNEFIKNDIGTAEKEEIENKLKKGTLVIDGIQEQINCTSLEELVRIKYANYKKTIGNPYIQTDTACKNALAAYNQKENRRKMIESLRKNK